jgi:hypothetical protein
MTRARTGLFLIGCLCALAPAPVFAEPVSREELIKALQDRDRVIEALEKRIRALENDRNAAANAPTTTTNMSLATAAPANSPVTSTIGNDASDSAADEDVELEALSRALVARGALVLPEWSVEVVPSVDFSHNQTSGLVLATTPEGFTTVVTQRLRDDTIRAALGLRVGLPWDNQVSVRVPYVMARESVALGDGSHSSQESHNMGDIDVELSHQFVREQSWRPDILGAILARIPTGDDPFSAAIPNLASGSGTFGLKGRVTAVKSGDPMVFFGTLSYATNFSEEEFFGEVDPGNTFGLELGAVLAVTPETSLTFAFAQDFTSKTEVDGVAIQGTDQLSSVVQLGADFVLSPTVLMNTSLGIGITDDAPDYDFVVSFPVRFN